MKVIGNQRSAVTYFVNIIKKQLKQVRKSFTIVVIISIYRDAHHQSSVYFALLSDCTLVISMSIQNIAVFFQSDLICLSHNLHSSVVSCVKSGDEETIEVLWIIVGNEVGIRFVNAQSKCH